MEFHLPYLALRDRPMVSDPRGLRRSFKMLRTRNGNEADMFFYEAQISVLLVGVDEWFWTVYCCVETFFESERDPAWYEAYNFDAPTGGGRQASHPVWSPRGYFLLVLSRRMNQVTKEWTNIVKALEDCLEAQVHVS